MKLEYVSNFLQCPECCLAVSATDTAVSCSRCGSSFTVTSNFIDFKPVVSIPEIYKSPDYNVDPKIIEKLHSVHYGNPLSQFLENAFKKALCEIIIPSDSPFLDVGCGRGLAFDMIGAGNDVVGVDINGGLLLDCARDHPSSICIRDDVTSGRFRENSFKNILCLSTLEHIFHLEKFVTSISNILSPLGYFYVLIPTEGGLVWRLLRNIAHFSYSKKLGFNYKKFLAIEHINKYVTIDNVLRKFFIVEKMVFYPFNFPSYHCNMVCLYRLRKR
jgi:phosphatidylethanolamine/phosphatidyl-N-methylethanolamine N-methyltransferase